MRGIIWFVLGITLSCEDATTVEVSKSTNQTKKPMINAITIRYHSDDTDYKNDGMLLRTSSNKEPLSGLVFWSYENGQLAYERNYKDGLLHGISKSWYENGQRSSVGNFLNEKLNGSVKAWGINGDLEYDRDYEKGNCIRGCLE